MQLFPDSKTLISFGIFKITYYALGYLFGGGTAYYFALKDMKRNGYTQDTVDDIFFGAFISGIIGARIWYVLFSNLNYYLSDPIRILFIFEGGLAIQGGIIAGLLYGYYYTKKHKMSFFRAADAFLPNFLIAQTIGRWGNFMNQEAYGEIVSEAFYNGFPAFIKNKMYIDGAYRQPTFLWESVLNLLGFILIRYVYKKYNRNKRGDLAYMYLVWYGVTRFFVEGFRTDSLMFKNIRMAQLTSIVFVIVGLLGILGVFDKFIKKEKPVILFDLDGTLLDTTPAILESYRYLFKKYRTLEEFDREKEIEVQGPPLFKMFEKYFPNQNTDELIKEYRDYNHSIHKEFVKPMANTSALLEHLSKEGYKIGVVSTKLKESVLMGLELFKLDDYVKVIVGLDDVSNSKPDPEGIIKACKLLNHTQDECIYIGDTPTDIKAAQNAGVYSIGYIFDEDRKQSLIDSKPNTVINDLLELKGILKKGEKSWTKDTM
ncbi:MAG: prolipoprotein diacylglyceryl transferase [Erysipelotrichaceae bacterium]|nr:prolipoprotein diacylglyceryl transferase [Erysipelotrichaceae bacterium]